MYVWEGMGGGGGNHPNIAFRHLPPRKDVVNQCLEFGLGAGGGGGRETDRQTDRGCVTKCICVCESIFIRL